MLFPLLEYSSVAWSPCWWYWIFRSQCGCHGDPKKLALSDGQLDKLGLRVDEEWALCGWG